MRTPCGRGGGAMWPSYLGAHGGTLGTECRAMEPREDPKGATGHPHGRGPWRLHTGSTETGKEQNNEQFAPMANWDHTRLTLKPPGPTVRKESESEVQTSRSGQPPIAPIPCGPPQGKPLWGHQGGCPGDQPPPRAGALPLSARLSIRAKRSSISCE